MNYCNAQIGANYFQGLRCGTWASIVIHSFLLLSLLFILRNFFNVVKLLSAVQIQFQATIVVGTVI